VASRPRSQAIFQALADAQNSRLNRRPLAK
jgi:hypothetical protein